MRLARTVLSVLVFLFVLLETADARTPIPADIFAAPTATVPPRPLPLNQPKPFALSSRETFYTALSADGVWLVTVEKGETENELWLYPATAKSDILPRLLLSSPARLAAPALSADGGLLLYIDGREDVKGDIWLLELKGKAPPRRLTDRQSEDDAPVFAADGRSFFYQTLRPGERQRQIVRRDLATGNETVLAIGRDAAFPSPSPDGRFLVFSSQPTGGQNHLWLLEFATGQLRQLTDGAQRDLYPAWENDRTLLFARLDEAGAASEGQESTGGRIYRLYLQRTGLPAAFPLTAAALSALQPRPTADGFLFIAARGGLGQVLMLPEAGEIPARATVKEQWQLAQDLLDRRPLDAERARLACARVREAENEPTVYGAQAALALAGLWEDAGEAGRAASVYAQAQANYRTLPAAAALAKIGALRLRTTMQARESAQLGKRQTLLDAALRTLNALATADAPAVAARALIDAARLLTDLGSGAEASVQAIDHLDRALAVPALPAELAAEAAFRRAALLARLAPTEGAAPLLVAVAEEHGAQEHGASERWVAATLGEIVEHTIANTPDQQHSEQIRALAALAEDYRQRLPALSMAAWNRIGDLYFADEEWARAKNAYRTVLDEFPQLSRQSAAARFALAEILYREERYGDAVALYEQEMARRVDEDQLYQQARRAYIGKTLAAGESLYRLGEVAAARNLFLGLIRYDYSIIEAHRGYSKAVAAEGQAAQLLALYRQRLASRPDDGVSLYAAGLTQTYLPGEKNLAQAEELLKQATLQLPEVEYVAQTRGYVAEVLETVHGRPQQLERARAHYRRALYLNRSTGPEENRAHLELNLGNVAFLLGQYASAFGHYERRLASGVPFDHADTELLFHQRYGAAAFQVRRREEPVTAYRRALQLLDGRLDPGRPAELFGRLAKAVSNSLFQQAPTSKEGQQARTAQEEIAGRLALLGSRPPLPPPAAEWDAYARELSELLIEQRAVFSSADQWAGAEAAAKQPEFDGLATRVEEALRAIPRLVESRAELLDRLGLACQEAERWEEAREAFSAAFELNQALGKVENLARNRRSAALTIWRAAELQAGEGRRQLLLEARAAFAETLELLAKYPPTPAKKQGKQGDGLLNLTTTVALDESNATAAAFGFSAAQEQRLAKTFLARIDSELGRIGAAALALQKQLQSYPAADAQLAAGDRYGVALLAHRSAHLQRAQGNAAAAYDGFVRSARLSLEQQNPISAMLNLGNAGELLGTFPAGTNRLDAYLELAARIAALAEDYRATLPGLAHPVFHNALGVSLVQAALASAAPQREALLQQALAQLDKGLLLLKEGAAAPQRPRLELRTALQLNRGMALTALGLSAGAEQAWQAALHSAEDGLLPGLAWRALAGLGRYAEAMARLDTVPLGQTGLQAGELVAYFAPWLIERTAADPEDGLTLVEVLAERERVELLAPDWLGLGEAVVERLLDAVVGHLAAIDELQERLASAGKADSDYLRLRLAQEDALVSRLLGERLERLPAAYGEVNPQGGALLLRLAAAARQVAQRAQQAVAAGTGEQAQHHSYQQALATYQQAANKLRQGLASGAVDPLARLAMAESAPIEALMDRLPGEQLAVRLVELAADDWLLFTIGNAGVDGERLGRAEVEERLAQQPELVAIFEEPQQLPAASVLCWGISVSQLVRSLENRKPFRRQLFDPAGHWPAEPPFASLTGHSAQLQELLPLAHTFILPGAAGDWAKVPTRTGEAAGSGVFWLDEAQARQPLTALAGRTGGLGLLAAPATGNDQAYALGHLASLLGIPSLLLNGSGAGDLPTFFAVYSELPAADAALESGLLLVGDWGLDTVAARALGEKQFADFGREGVKEHNAGRYRQALGRFENALAIAAESPKLAQYRTMLHRYARESAYAADDLPRAVRHGQALVDGLAKEKPYSPEHADAQLRLGLLLGWQERYGEAAAIMAESVETFAELGEAAAQAKALADFGIVMENATDYGRALSLFQEAAGLQNELGAPRNLAEQYRHLGRVHDLRLSQYGTALQFYRRAQAIYRQLQLPTEEAETLLEQGRCQRLLGNFPAAAQSYQAALALLPAQGGERTRARIVLEQANNAWFQGSYQEAFDLRRQAALAAEENAWPLEQVIAGNTGGLIWWTLGDNQRALLDLRSALEQARRLAVRQDEVATTLNNIGLVLREMGRFAEARQTLEEALAIDRRLGSRWAIAYDLRNIALTLLRQGEAAAALPLLDEALALTAAIGDRVNQAKVLLALGETRHALGDSAAAAEHYDEALALADAMLLREVRWRALFGLAAVAAAQGDRQGAVACNEQAMATIEEMRADIRLDQLKDGFLTNKMDVYAAQIALLVELDRVAEAFAVAERSRARSLIDLLGQQRLSLADVGNGELYEGQLRLKEQIREQEMLAVQAAGSEERALYGAALERLQAQYKDLLLEIEAQHPEMLSLVRVEPLTVAEVQALLEPGVVLLSYYQLSDSMLCWRLTGNDLQLFRTPLTAGALGGQMTAYRRMLQNLEPAENLAAALYRQLLAEPLRGVDPAAVLGIIPHGALHYLSFATLSDGRDYLIDRHPLFYLPSASVFRFTLERRQQEKNSRVLAIGNPDLGDRALDLPFAEREAATLRWNYPEVTTLTRERATESWVRANIERFGIIHLASHGEFDPVNPLFSAIRLAGDDEADGSLEIEEIFGLSLNADLVVLSACETGLGELTSGDDVIGMNRAFLFAGTHALVSSLWRVSDVSTAVLMKQFYRDYTQYDKAASLRRAMLHVKNRYPHPGYWGAFTLIGDYR